MQGVGCEQNLQQNSLRQESFRVFMQGRTRVSKENRGEEKAGLIVVQIFWILMYSHSNS